MSWWDALRKRKTTFDHIRTHAAANEHRTRTGSLSADNTVSFMTAYGSLVKWNQIILFPPGSVWLRIVHECMCVCSNVFHGQGSRRIPGKCPFLFALSQEMHWDKALLSRKSFNEAARSVCVSLCVCACVSVWGQCTLEIIVLDWIEVQPSWIGLALLF